MTDRRARTKPALLDELARLKRRYLVVQTERTREIRRLNRALEEMELQRYQFQTRQHELDQVRDRYARLYDASPVGHLSLDHIGRIRDLNAAAAFILGEQRTRLLGQPLIHYIDTDSRNRFFSHLHGLRNGVDHLTTALTFKSKDGAACDVELISAKAPADETTDLLCHTAIIDITERIRAARALQESEVKSRWLIENIPVVVWTIDRMGSPRYVSANVQALLGYSEREIRGAGARFWLRNVHPDDRASVTTAYHRLFNEQLRSAEAAFELEYRRRTKDGSWVWTLDKVMSVTEEQGKRRYATGVFWDITRRKFMEDRLRESEARFRQLAENIDEVFYLISADRNELYYVSSAVEKVWGLTPQALYENPRAWERLIHPEDRARVEGMLGARSGNQPYEVEFRVTTRAGALRWIRARGFPILDEAGHPYRVAGIAEDVTARKNAEASQAEANQWLREFSVHLEAAREEERARISREIHDELGALLLTAKIDLDACCKDYGGANPGLAKTMVALMGRIDSAIDAVRRISTALRPSVLDNVGVLAAVEWQVQELSQRTGIRCKVASNADGELDLDPQRATAVFRIVQEALTNVVRHSGATKVDIALREGSAGLELRIKDNGKGFNTTRPPDFQHWGLVGMAERARALGGTFAVESAPKKGTTIRVVIPIAPSR